MWWNWIIACWLGFPCVTPLSALDFLVVVEEWHPSCFEQHVAERNDADEFERLAFAWLLCHEEEIATDIAKERGLNLIYWWHEADFADNSPYGATVVVGLKVRTTSEWKGGSHVAAR